MISGSKSESSTLTSTHSTELSLSASEVLKQFQTIFDDKRKDHENLQFVQSQQFINLLEGLSKLPNTNDQEGLKYVGGEVRKLIQNYFRRIDPKANDTKLIQLLENYQQLNNNSEAAGPVDLTLKRSILNEIASHTRIVESQENYKTFNSIYQKVLSLLNLHITSKISAFGRSNRAKNAKPASVLFNAKFKHDQNTKVDKDGNAIGNNFDLGKDGAYKGLKVLVLHEYTLEGFDFKLPQAALERKGFTVERYTPTNMPDASKLKQIIQQGISQLWLISSSSKILNDQQLEVIAEGWKNGMALYIFGDNQPYYVDANILLSKIDFKFTLSGNSPGGTILNPLREILGRKVGFNEDHYVSFGISKLYEGVTVSYFEKKVISFTDFEPILYDHDGQLVVICRKAKEGCGPLIVDGAFTKLFCQWDTAGSARFVCNCACWLSAILPDEEQNIQNENSNSKLNDDEAKEVKEPSYDYFDSFNGECEISLEEGPLAFLATNSALADENTDDITLDNPFGAGEKNHNKFSVQLYHVNTANKFFEEGAYNPFNRTSVAAVLPLVKLNNKINRKLFTNTICHWLMGGLYMPQKAFFILFAIIDSKLIRLKDSNSDNDNLNIKALKFMQQEILDNITSTIDFLDVGPQVCLIDAMSTVCNGSSEMDVAFNRKIFSHNTVIIRTLLNLNKISKAQAARLVRQSFIKKYLTAISNFIKRAEESSNLNLKMVVDYVDSKVFDLIQGVITKEFTAKLINIQQLTYLDGGMIYDDYARYIELDLDSNSILNPNECTLLLHSIKNYQGNWQLSIENLLEKFKTSRNLYFNLIWDNSIEEINKLNAVEIFNLEFARYHALDELHGETPLFVSGYGPSVFHCVCGYKFADIDEEMNDELVEKIKNNRARHFALVYGAQESTGYPLAFSSHCNLHRAIQVVLTRPENKKVNDYNEGLLKDVCKYLASDGKGFIHSKRLEIDMEKLIRNFIQLRNEGAPQPPDNCTITLLSKIQIEKNYYSSAKPL